MKRTIIAALLAVIIIGAFCMGASQDTQIKNLINDAIQEGKVSKISAYFAPNVDVAFNNSKVNITSQEAQKVVEEFFRTNKPQICESSQSRNYISCNMTTASGRQYTVDYALRTVNNHTVITGMYFY